ncbi:hypothetical protein [Sinorhizobium sp. RAC02]|uniref:hypothetical protein n=1 Tax=Sinorhizobium sp. RAC02 TaxID=1842534 RepID=UPI00083DC6A6|nr:hypothetical protein [Sinorhizobium sp. RAC02]AOF90269.1 hypothetical protein BSY16_1502 [Sinorhizobium sp. RAC02]
MEAREKHAVFSTLRENIVEHLFAGELLRRLWQKDILDAEILKSEFDAGGYDLVLTCRNVTRHIQLKISRKGGARAEVNISLRLAEKASGCVVWIVVDDDLKTMNFRWFGDTNGGPLPDIADLKVVRHSKGNAQGVKHERLGHRIVPQKRFTPLESVDELLLCLLGSAILN